MPKFHPFVIMVSAGIIVLFLSLLGYQISGAMGFLLSTCILMILVSFFIGMAWAIYPWQLALWGCLPSCLFLVWRFLTVTSEPEASLNESLYIFLPIISLASTYFGAFAGRRVSIRKKRKSSVKS